MVAHGPVALLLEDEALVALDVEDVLRQLGYEPVVLSACSAALHWLADNPPPALAVIDVELTDGPCDAVAEVLRQRQIPHVIYSGTAGPVPPFDAGIWLPKPSARAALKLAVGAAVGSLPADTPAAPSPSLRGAPA